LTYKPEVDGRWALKGEDYSGVAVDSSYVYWSAVRYTTGLGSIHRASLTTPDVTDTTFKVTGIEPRGLAVDSQYVYWTDAKYDNGTQPGKGTIGRVLLSTNGLAGAGINS
jgi:hypothetical protein